MWLHISIMSTDPHMSAYIHFDHLATLSQLFGTYNWYRETITSVNLANTCTTCEIIQLFAFPKPFPPTSKYLV
jgi:hypothetical protein